MIIKKKPFLLLPCHHFILGAGFSPFSSSSDLSLIPSRPPEKASVGGLSPGRAMAARQTDSSTPNYPQASWRANVEGLRQTVIHGCASSKALQTGALHQSQWNHFNPYPLRKCFRTEERGLWLVNLKIYFHIKRHYENIRWLLYTLLCIKRT